MKESVLSKKILKKTVPKLLPDASKTGAVIRAIREAGENKLSPDMLPVVLASFQFDDGTLLNLVHLYEQVSR